MNDEKEKEIRKANERTDEEEWRKKERKKINLTKLFLAIKIKEWVKAERVRWVGGRGEGGGEGSDVVGDGSKKRNNNK